ncbi:hypothetical protein GIB67_023575 [Kingdonia uniflora]|uniref:Uncharacterized protein n=1 Tax=Kingdonia uniflora TaxID=39325 RepID=A0A7J7PAW4_9MAGN|nr:hypothetical protein GIB67_023575 [Kingdonia uniflora]
MPGHLEELIGKINGSCNDNSNKITCVIADENMGWAIGVAKKMGIPQASFWPGLAGLKALILHNPQLIKEGVIDDKGKNKYLT